MSRSPKQSPEEMRLATMARVFGEHPDNEVAWKKLCDAALDFARSKGLGSGQPLRPVATATIDPSAWSSTGWDAWIREMARRGAGVRPASKQKTEQVKQARRRVETAQEAQKREQQEGTGATPRGASGTVST